jgi:hypothetical protein
VSGGDRQPRCRESFFRDAFSSGVGRAFHGGTSQAAQCAPTVASRPAAGGNSQRARGAPGSRRSHRQLGWQPLGRATRRSVRGSAGCATGNRTTTGWFALATLPRPLSPPAPLPRIAATIRKSLRPTASRTHGTNSETQKQIKNKIKNKIKPNTMSLLSTPGGNRGTGHFYFALTRSVTTRSVTACRRVESFHETGTAEPAPPRLVAQKERNEIEVQTYR